MRYVDLGNSVSKHQQNRRKENKKSSSSGKTIVIIGIILFVGLVLALAFRQYLPTFLDPISIVSNVVAADLEESDGRTNVLVLGSDKRSKGEVSSELTDTILVASIGRVENNIVLISLPRDLWVTSPKGYHSKINAIYGDGGSEDISAVVEDVLGIPIHYHAVIDFILFKDAIDILGGIDVEVEREFDDFYFPVEGKENAPIDERYETVHFDEGLQTMDGDMALKFVRSRKGTNGEGTDFARAARQQKVILAIKERALSLETLIDIGKLKDLYDAYHKNVDTNMDFKDLQGFYLLSQQLNFDKFRTIVLDDRSAADSGGLLYAPTDNSLYGGAYVLIPKAGDFSQLHAYVQRYIFSDEE
jgi:polyisoprenyl-teichoic acid--peptidoglycan teichoic acid transferase